MFNYNLFISRLSNTKQHLTSFIKNEVAQRLLKRLEFINLKPKSIYIDGYTDDAYIKALTLRFPDSEISTDANQTHDLIISNTTIHLTENIADRLDQCFEMLNQDGVLLFSTFGNKSFSSLNNAFLAIDNLPHTNAMIDAKTWGGLLQSSPYKAPAIESDLITFTYENITTFFEDIRHLNEPLADTKMSQHFTGKTKWQKALNELEKNFQLEIEALYGYAVRKDKLEEIQPKANPNRMSLEDLKKQIADFKKS